MKVSARFLGGARYAQRELLTRLLLQAPLLLALEAFGVVLVVLVLLTLPLAKAGSEASGARTERALEQLAMVIAATVDGDLHETLVNPDQAGSEAHVRLLAPLVRFHNELPGIYNLYTLRVRGNQMLFVLDTARSPALERIGDRATALLEPMEFDQSQEPEMVNTVFGGHAYIDSRAYTADGQRRALRSVEAPIRNSRGEVVALLGLDYEEDKFLGRSMNWRTAVIVGGSADVVLGSVIGALVYWLRRRIGEALAELDRTAKTDALTGLYNRRYFNRRLARAAAAATSAEPLALLIFDADFFKRINDSYGHPAGDAVLRRIADCLRAETTPAQLCCRIGGEEFAVILPGADGAAAMALFQRLSHAIRQPLALEQATVEVTVSGGIAVFQPEVEDENRLLNRADQALYIAKNSGRDFAVLAAPVQA